MKRLDESKQTLERLRMEFTTYGFPENLFVVNCIVLHLQRNGCISHEDLEEMPDLPRMCEFERVPYLEWDARTAPFDFNHVHRLIPIDREKSMFELSVARSWSGLQGNHDYQRKVVKRFRDLVADCRMKT